MKITKGSVLYSSKPTIWYYLMILFCPVMFFLIDDSYDVFRDWTLDNWAWLPKLFGVFMFFGIPILLVLFRRELVVYEDCVYIAKPALRKVKIYYFENLEYWTILTFYYRATSTQTVLTLKFRNKKITFNKIELTAFGKLQEILERDYFAKKR